MLFTSSVCVCPIDNNSFWIFFGHFWYIASAGLYFFSPKLSTSSSEQFNNVMKLQTHLKVECKGWVTSSGHVADCSQARSPLQRKIHSAFSNVWMLKCVSHLSSTVLPKHQKSQKHFSAWICFASTHDHALMAITVVSAWFDGEVLP